MWEASVSPCNLNLILLPMNERHRFIFGLVLLLATVGIGIWQWSVLSSLKTEAKAFETSIASLTSTSETLASDYQDLKKEVDASREIMEQQLSVVFPHGENISQLTRLFDDYAVKNNFDSNPFFISDIRYSKAGESELSASYSHVPLTLNVTTTRKNLSKFLEMIENSGSLDAEVRLMGVDKMSVEYPSEYGGTYKATLDVNAYYTP